MSVMLISERDLAQVAAYASHHGLLPTRTSAVAFVEHMREVNRAFWSERYGHTVEDEPEVSAYVHEALNAMATIRPHEVMQTIFSLHYNSDLEAGSSLIAALVRIVGRIGEG